MAMAIWFDQDRMGAHLCRQKAYRLLMWGKPFNIGEPI